MNIKRLSIGAVVGGVVIYGLGILIWQMLFADFFEANRGSAMGVDREMPILWASALGALLYADLITYVLERGGSKSIADGATVGAIVGLLLWGTSDFTLYAYLTLDNLTATIADPVLEGIRGGITGAVIAAVLAKVGD